MLHNVNTPKVLEIHLKQTQTQSTSKGNKTNVPSISLSFQKFFFPFSFRRYNFSPPLRLPLELFSETIPCPQLLRRLAQLTSLRVEDKGMCVWNDSVNKLTETQQKFAAVNPS
ncbi:hypothetical protein TNCT_240291 [Trichonephila clavata]|uniref:Uncharacterized protein n=1 Tax=Trichonephila clavata TaxID=2740835 RepID=A0A8X6GTB4_TRICU|nr:hypothetical protein TNCT_240291 [Trichonephila clavata]